MHLGGVGARAVKKKKILVRNLNVAAVAFQAGEEGLSEVEKSGQGVLSSLVKWISWELFSGACLGQMISADPFARCQAGGEIMIQ